LPGSLDRPGQSHAPDQPEANEVPRQLRSSPSRPDLPTIAENSDDTDRLAARDRPEHWSKAELRQRLEHLPPGHPSSLHWDDPDDSRIETPGELDDPKRDADASSGLDNPDGPADAVSRNYWSEASRFQQASADHMRRWPNERVAPAQDRTGDPDGSWHGEGARYLNPDQHAQAREVIDAVQQTGEKLTEHLGEAERENLHGGWLEGLEFRLKSEERLKEKIADLLETGAPDAPTEEVVRQIPDAIRYTFCAKPENYKDVYWDIQERLQEHGHEMYYSENHWTDTQYKGINTRWITPEGQRFEVQFHTSESFHAKQTITHASYERLRNPLTRDEERQELMAFQQEVCSWIATPEGVTDIPNHRKEDR
jgi:hypothetical protein